MKRRDSFCFSLPININWHLVLAEDYGRNPGVKTTKPLGTGPLWLLCRFWKSPDAGCLYIATKWNDSYPLKDTISDFLNNCHFIFLWHPNTLLKTPRGLEKRVPGAVFRKAEGVIMQNLLSQKGKCCKKKKKVPLKLPKKELFNEKIIFKIKIWINNLSDKNIYLEYFCLKTSDWSYCFLKKYLN